MSNVRDRLEELKKGKGIKTDSDLLRLIYPFLKQEGKVKYDDAETFVSKTKGSFSQMVEGKSGRKFDQDFYLPLEKVLDTSMAYLLEGRNAPLINEGQRGLRYAAKTDTLGNYEKLIEEGVYNETDEYHWSLLDYMVKFRSRVGLEFFAERDELPFGPLGIAKPKNGIGLTANQYEYEEVLDCFISICSPKSVLKYFDGYYYANNRFGVAQIDKYDVETVTSFVPKLLAREDIWTLLSDYRESPISEVNPFLEGEGNGSGETAAFVNFFLVLMLDYSFSHDSFGKEEMKLRLLDKAIEANKAVMDKMLQLPYNDYRIEEYGFVYSSNILCGSIVKFELGVNPIWVYPKTIQDKINDLFGQIESFHNKLNDKNKSSIQDGKMRIKKRKDPDFYAFYRLMEESKCDLVARFKEKESSDFDLFLLPDGEKGALPSEDKDVHILEAFEVLSKIDSVSSSSLGKEKTYVFPELGPRSFFFHLDHVSGIAPTKVKIGGRYDNLAELLAETYLFMPRVRSASDQVDSVAAALTAYKVSKGNADEVLRQIEEYYNRRVNKLDKRNEQGKLLVFNYSARRIWISIYSQELKGLLQ